MKFTCKYGCGRTLPMVYEGQGVCEDNPACVEKLKSLALPALGKVFKAMSDVEPTKPSKEER